MRKENVLILGALFLAAVASAAEPSLTDGHAKEFVEDQWNKLGFVIKLGQQQIGTSKIPIMYQAFEELGLINVSILQAKEFFNPLVFSVTKTALGERIAKEGGLPQADGFLILKQGTFQLDKVVRNEARRKGVDDYRLIMVTYTAKWSPEAKRVGEKRGVPFADTRKARWLLKYDPFASKWTVVAADAANRDADFNTNNVPNALGD